MLGEVERLGQMMRLQLLIARAEEAQGGYNGLEAEEVAAALRAMGMEAAEEAVEGLALLLDEPEEERGMMEETALQVVRSPTDLPPLGARR